MRRRPPARLIAFLTALLVSLTAPGLAVAHGLAHDHLAHEHAAAAAHHANEAGHDDARDHGAETPALQAAEHEHQHGHATVAVAPGARELSRLDLPVAPAVAPEPAPPPTTLIVVRSAALSDRALLARPDPESGPPPRLRAPPVG
ncbi:MAG: hypothetical protein ACXWZS_04070 [Gemmatirosa sp.]